MHISDSSSVHHQEFIHCTLNNGICHTGLKKVFEQDQDGTLVVRCALEVVFCFDLKKVIFQGATTVLLRLSSTASRFELGEAMLRQGCVGLGPRPQNVEMGVDSKNE